MARKSDKGRKKSKKEAAPAGDAAREELARLIKNKESRVTDGALQVVIAIASVTSLVTIDTTRDPAVVDPEEIDALTFGDPRVGMSDEQVGIFKSNLGILLPQISHDIDQIPENADLPIGGVMDFVRLSLLAG